jgi:chaperonin GroEL
VIKVGAATETEMKEKKARVEDAMHATRAAVEEGIVPGGGVTLLRAAKALETVKAEGDEQIGVDIVRRACEEPLRQIAANAGWEGAIVTEKIRSDSNSHYGFNAETGRYEDLVESGVIDPTKVCRTAIQNASSVAALMLTTEAMVAEIPEKKPAPVPAGHAPDMDY